ncbi:beta-glucuronidase [Yeosuana aromativorans]|uniref:Beta-glucuronidase n=1 Tax=Yeosuana aromativorans TaxID=288019 RepID=A0A8J3BNV1_9FLAO|nr:glycoside hydrolase family 2 TIM barrel-domain containing protein [Yeosuana aromativorans]GGK27795.1 beta-glucuronidase [Yeosuana aromativorans]
MKRTTVLIVLLLPIMSFSQDLITNTINRNTTTLNGTWHYIIDPYETGYYNYRHEPYDKQTKSDNRAFYKNYHTDDKLELVEYDFDKSQTLLVPGDWNSQNEKLLYYEGTIWYKKSFDYKKSNPLNRLFLYFGAINYKAEVYLNGQKLGTHIGGFTPFNYEISSIVKPKNNYLVVKVDNKRTKEAIPTINTDWWNYGGITRDVKLIEEPQSFVQDYSIQLKKGSNTSISGFIKLNNVLKEEKVTISIPELKVQTTVLVKNDNKIGFEINTKGIHYWSPESPKLYAVNIKTDYQTLEDHIGFRTIEVKGPKILLNGKSVFLKGISIHEENPMRAARAFNDADALVLLNWAKELGCNYVRLAHYPHNEHIVRMADQLGMMVWEEIPVYWTIDFKNESALNNAKNQLTEAITRDKNRACIVIWSMANETPPSDARNKFLIDLVNHTKSFDNTRLISAALETHNKNGVNIVDDKMGEYLDIVAFNQYTGWYGGSLENAPNAKWDISYDKPVVISEFGGGALQGLHGTIKERWTEEYQEYLYQQNLRMIDKIPNISGISPWILVDFKSPKRLLPNIQDGWNRKGLISNNGIKKKAFYILQKYYKNKEHE